MKPEPRITIKRGKDKPVLARHPWVFSGAIADSGQAADGETVEVFDASGNWLARGYYNSHSQIAVRLWTWDRQAVVDTAFLRARLTRALASRQASSDRSNTNAYRLVNAESDLMPGLVVDRYGDWLVAQFLTLGIDRCKTEIIAALAELVQPRGIYERSDVDVREKEGLTPTVGVLYGEEPPDRIEIIENGLRLLVDCKRGHKTGFYLDQSENRRRVAGYWGAQFSTGAAKDPTLLNVFSYSGAFGVYSCKADPRLRVVNLDASDEALDLAKENMRLNGVETQGEYLQGDAFVVLRKLRDQGRSFDAIILDPPKFVYSQSQLQSGLRGYKDMNLLAIKLLKPGGMLVTCSCSGLVSEDLFQKVVAGAAVDAGRDVQIIAKLLQAPDHPILLSFPESEYLKGLVCRVV